MCLVDIKVWCACVGVWLFVQSQVLEKCLLSLFLYITIKNSIQIHLLRRSIIGEFASKNNNQNNNNDGDDDIDDDDGDTLSDDENNESGNIDVLLFLFYSFINC